MRFAAPRQESEETLYQLSRFLHRDELDHATRVNILGFASPSLQSLISMRRSIWSDDEFYTEENRYERIDLAINMIYRDYEDLDQTCEVMRAILSRDGLLNAREVVGDTFLGLLLLWSLLAHLTARIANYELTLGIGRPSGFKALVADILPIAKHSYKAETLQDGVCWSLIDTLKSLIFFIVSVESVGPIRFSATTRYAEVTLQSWLEILEAAGVDLRLYGEREVPAVSSLLREQALFLHGRPKRSPSSGQPAQLCCLQYGPTPADWKFWWREPSDEFVGEFWVAVEFEVPRLPGSWVDDEDIDCQT